MEMVTPDGDVWPSERWSPEMTLVYDLKWLQEPETYGHLRWSSEQGYQSQLKWSHMPEPMDIWAWSCELEAGGHQRWSPEPELYDYLRMVTPAGDMWSRERVTQAGHE